MSSTLRRVNRELAADLGWIPGSDLILRVDDRDGRLEHQIGRVCRLVRQVAAGEGVSLVIRGKKPTARTVALRRAARDEQKRQDAARKANELREERAKQLAAAP